MRSNSNNPFPAPPIVAFAAFFAILAACPSWAQPAAGPANLPAVAPVMDCAALAQADLTKVADAPMHVTAAVPVMDGQPAPYCKVTGYVEPKVNFEIHLPLSTWTQRYLQTGCGGLCGNLNLRPMAASGCAPADHGELATAATDMGHKSSDAGWEDDARLMIDFAYRGQHVTAVAAKALITKYYGQAPKYSYFNGCSDGGREALMEAQRYPGDFNGIVAGAPAMNFITQNTFYHAWNARTNSGTSAETVLTADKLPVLHAAALAACDELDGLKDKVIGDPRACKFDPAVTQCKAGQDPGACLTAAQVDIARKIYQGANDGKGQQLVISGPVAGSEMAWSGVYVPQAPGGRIGSTGYSTEVIQYMAFAKNPPTLADFKFDEATFKIIAPMHAVYDATDPNLKPFAGAGGKLILWHGWSDGDISPLNTINYYKAMQDAMGVDAAAKFARLYVLPGVQHCGGGDGTADVDWLSPIMAWTERGAAPNALLGSHRPQPARGGPGSAPGAQGAAGGRGAAPAAQLPVDRTRPVYPYPMVARYKGTGNPDEAANFEGAAPKAPMPEKFNWLGASFYSSGYQQWCTATGKDLNCSAAKK